MDVPKKYWWIVSIVVPIIVAILAIVPQMMRSKTEGKAINGTKLTDSYDSEIIIKQINSHRPDYVVLKNNASVTIDIGGYELWENDNHYKLPIDSNITKLDPNETLRIFFLKENDTENKSNYINTGNLVSTDFRIKEGELIELKDGSGVLKDKKTAP
jgi:hypothetical protein